MKKILPLLLLLSFGSAGCATSFQGDAHISPSDCRTRCTEIGGDMAAYVFMGQYSSACVCEPSGRHASSAGSTAGGVGGAVAGVWMQMQEAERRQQQR